jgi:putative membrane protein
MKTPALLFAATLLGACSSQQPANETAEANASAAANATAAAPATPARALSPEEEFVNSVAAIDAYAAAAGRLAQEKGTAATKRLGKQLEDDHGQFTAKVTYAAKDVPGGVFVNASLSPEQMAGLEKLQGLSGAAFDSEFRQQMAAAHQSLERTMESYRTGGSEQALKVFAYQSLPKVRAHLSHMRS